MSEKAQISIEVCLDAGKLNLDVVTAGSRLPLYPRRDPARVRRPVDPAQPLVGAGLLYGVSEQHEAAVFEPFYAEVTAGLQKLITLTADDPFWQNCSEGERRHILAGADRVLSAYKRLHQLGLLEQSWPTETAGLEFHPVYRRLYDQLKKETAGRPARGGQAADVGQSARPGSNPSGAPAAARSGYGQTVERMYNLWERNWFRNAASRTEHNFLSFERRESCDVVVLAAAASVRQALDYPELLNNSLVLACDTVLPFILAHHLPVDYLVSVDAARGSLWHTWAGAPSCRVITWLGAHPVWFNEAECVLVATSFPWDQLLAARMNLVGIDNPGGNVMTMALSLARRLSSGRIHLFGTGLLDKANRGYFTGSGYAAFHRSHSSRLSGRRWQPPVSTWRRSFEGLPPGERDRLYIYGNPLLADRYSCLNGPPNSPDEKSMALTGEKAQVSVVGVKVNRQMQGHIRTGSQLIKDQSARPPSPFLLKKGLPGGLLGDAVNY